MKVSVECVTAATPEIAYATNIDIAHWPDFVRGIDRIELLTDGPIREGTRFRETSTMYGRAAVEEMTVAELQPPRRQVFTAENHGARYVATTEFVPEAAGTRIKLTFEGIAVSFAAKLLTPLMGFMAGSIRKSFCPILPMSHLRRSGARGVKSPSHRHFANTLSQFARPRVAAPHRNAIAALGLVRLNPIKEPAVKIIVAPMLLALVFATPAIAQSGMAQSGMAQSRMAPSPAVSMEKARQIAGSAGITVIEKIEMDDGKWEIDGRNSAGQEMDLEIDATTGRVVSMDMDDDDDRSGTVGSAPAMQAPMR